MAQEPGFVNVKAQLKTWWDTCKITRQKVYIEATAKRLYARKKQYYDPIEKLIGVPWYMVAVIDERESGARGGVLHNGEFIVGTGRKTKLVPAGRGPFSTWQIAAVDALSMPGKSFHKVPKDKWSIELILYCLESFNGWGYRLYHPRTPSPYVWSCTNIYDSSPRGKYIADGKWGEGVTDTQVGCAPLIKALMALEATEKPTGAIPAVVVGTIAVTGATTAVVATPVSYWPYIIIGTIIATGLGWLGVRWYQNRKIKTNV